MEAKKEERIKESFTQMRYNKQTQQQKKKSHTCEETELIFSPLGGNKSSHKNRQAAFYIFSGLKIFLSCLFLLLVEVC